MILGRSWKFPVATGNYLLPENLDIGVSRLDIAKLEVSEQQIAIWVCLKMGYIPNYSHLYNRDNDQQNRWVFWATRHFQTHPYCIL